MSLMHDAIKAFDEPQAPSPRQVVAAPRSGGSVFWSSVGGFTVVMLLGLGGYLLWQYLNPAPTLPIESAAPMARAETSQPEPLASAPSLPSSLPEVEVETERVAALAPPVNPTNTAPTSAPPPATGPETPPAAKAPTKPARSTMRAARRPKAVTERVEPAPPTPPEPSPQQNFQAFVQAMQAKDVERASARLNALASQLPPSSLSLLRARAWYALETGQTAAAQDYYKSLLERLPGDEEASVNLAALELQAQRIEPARKLLREALVQHPDSEQIKAALARFRSPQE